MSYRQPYQELYFPEDFEILYPEVCINANRNFDGEIESIDVLIDNVRDFVHCEEFSLNDVRVREEDKKRFKALQRKAKKELTSGMYNEKGNLIRKSK